MAKENQTQNFPAKSCRRSSSLVVVFGIAIFFSVTGNYVVESVISDHDELELVTAALRMYNYSIFANAVATSELRYTLSATTGASFTLFAPPDPHLISLDMVSNCRDYIHALDLHVVHRRLSFAALLESDYLETLLPRHHLYVAKHQVNSVYDGGVIAVGGVRISTPDLFLGHSIAVHGLDGMIASAIRLDEVQKWCPCVSEKYENSHVDSRLVNVGQEKGFDAEMTHGQFSKLRPKTL